MLATKQPYWLHDVLVRGMLTVITFSSVFGARSDIQCVKLLPTCLTIDPRSDRSDAAVAEDLDWMGMTLQERQDKAKELANMMRVLAKDPVLGAHQDLRRNCGNIVNFMESSFMFIQPSGNLMMPKQGCKRMGQRYGLFYDAVYMLRALRQVTMLRSSADLLPSLQNACQMLLPPHCADMFDKVLSSSRVPHKSTLSWFLMQADVGWMLYQRRCMAVLLESDNLPVCYMMADASEQAGTDWLITSYKMIEATNILKAADCVDDLNHWYESSFDMTAISDGADPPLIPSDVVAEEEFLRDAIHMVTLPPAGIGARHGSLVHKLHAKLHSSRLVMPSDKALQIFCKKCTVSHTTDMGTELLFNDVDADIVRFTRQFSDPVDVRPPSTSLLDIVSGSMSAEDVGVGSSWEGAADTGKARMHRLSITMPGLLHILHNAVVAMTDALEHFQWFYTPFNGLLGFMNRKIHRSLVLGTCFSTPPACHWKKTSKETSWQAAGALGFTDRQNR